MNDAYFMNLSIQEAWRFQGLTFPNPAVGCSIVSPDGLVLSTKAHECAGAMHAELHAISDAFSKLTNHSFTNQSPNEIHAYIRENHNNLFKDHHAYVTLEPCMHQGKTPSCASLLHTLGFSRICIGTLDPNATAHGGAKMLSTSTCDVTVGVEEEKAKALLQPFSTWQKDTFVLFKVAHTLNGVYDGGIISSHISRHHVHALRDTCELLVIGGNTVREDRPTLDARLVEGKAPDILILSQQSTFDKSIPLFNVPHRKVYIEKTLDRIRDYKYVLVEGVDSMLELTQEVTDMYLVYVAPFYKKGKTLQTSMNFELLAQQHETDMRLWMEKKRG